MTNKEIQTLAILEIVSPITDGHLSTLIEDESVRKAIYKRFKESKNWEYVFEPIEDETKRSRYIELFNRLDDEQN